MYLCALCILSGSKVWKNIEKISKDPDTIHTITYCPIKMLYNKKIQGNSWSIISVFESLFSVWRKILFKISPYIFLLLNCY